MQRFAKLSRVLRAGNAETPAFEGILDRLADNAVGEDAGSGDIAQSVALLRKVGLLSDDGTADPALTARRLMRVGAVNLSLGRLWEGHINALYLVKVHGNAAVQRRVSEMLGQDAFFGVWGADDGAAVTLDAAGERLSGAKKFASGLGVVSHAVVTVAMGDELRLALIDVGDQVRGDAAQWQMPGMRATASGRYDFTGLGVAEGDWIGATGDYLKEPHFIGGVWRIGALQIGGAIGLLEQAAAQLRAMDRMESEAQKTRLAPLLMRALAAAGLVEQAARQVATAPAEQAVSLSVAARLLTEEVALDAIKIVEQSLGIKHFFPDAVSGRMARDLSVYLRQAARDALLMRFADHVFDSDGAAWEMLE